MSVYKQFDPYQWPPDILLADLHYRCSMPGKQNPQGQQCPCCLKKQKLRTTNWISRDIIKDFKNYGGGIPAYFGLLTYYGISMLIIILLSVGIHLYSQHIAFNICINTAKTDKARICIMFYNAFEIMTTTDIIFTLKNNNHVKLAIILQNINFVVFVLLIVVNFMVSYYLIWIQKKITKRVDIVSRYSLFLKNIPKNNTVEDLRKYLIQILPRVDIKQIFFLHKISKYQQNYQKTLRSYFLIKYFQENQKFKQIQKQQMYFMQSFLQLVQSEKEIRQPTGRAIVIFQNIQDRIYFENYFYKDNISKFIYHTGKILKIHAQDSSIYADKMSEPGQILWKYIGDSSIFKTKVRIQTTLTSFIFFFICYAILFFPEMVAHNGKHATGLNGDVWSLVVSIILTILSNIYRIIMFKLSQQRKPNTHLSKSLFVTLTNVLFHICFYCLIPVIFYVRKSNSSSTQKLKSLLTQALIFLIVSVILQSIDLRHCCFQGDRKKILSNFSESHKYSQKQLHNILSVPAFPIENKLTLLYKIWSFVLFYSFQIPQLLIFLICLIFFIYWNDKKNIYTHYKMQAYLPIQLQQNFDQIIIYFLMAYTCFGYMIVAQPNTWSYYLAPAITLFALIMKYILRKIKVAQDTQKKQVQRGVSLNNLLKRQSETQSLLQQLINEEDIRYSMSSYIGTTSLKSLERFWQGYKESYEVYLHQFKNKRINELFELEYKKLSAEHDRKRTQSQLVHI